MPISQSKYVDIKSGINRTQLAREKELIARIFTTNEVVAKQEVLEFEDIKDIINLFGAETDETKIATKYFSFVNKYARKPKKISFARDFSAGFDGYTQATKECATLAEFKTTYPSPKGMTMTYGDKQYNKAPIMAIDLTSCNSLADVATLVQGWIRTAFEDDDILQSSTLTYDSGSNTFRFEPNEDSDRNTFMSFTGNFAEMLGLADNQVPIKSFGADASSYSDVFDYSYQLNNNFATFVFTDNTISANNIATLANHIKEKYPSEFMYVVPVTESNKDTIQSAVSTIDGVSLELCEGEGAYNFVMPMAITATTDYDKENGTVNYMFTQYNEMAVVVDDDDNANANDNLKINYYGRTQQAGNKLAFYQNGVLQGGFQDQNIYVNEIWLKDALSTKFLNYMLSTSNWYANKAGQSIGQGLITDVIDRAKLNGTITTEKEINEDDRVFILNITSDENAWRQIYQEGYYLVTDIVKVTENNQIKYKFVYTLIYSKGDSIKKVEGYNILV